MSLLCDFTSSLWQNMRQSFAAIGTLHACTPSLVNSTSAIPLRSTHRLHRPHRELIHSPPPAYLSTHESTSSTPQTCHRCICDRHSRHRDLTHHSQKPNHYSRPIPHPFLPCAAAQQSLTKPPSHTPHTSHNINATVDFSFGYLPFARTGRGLAAVVAPLQLSPNYPASSIRAHVFRCLVTEPTTHPHPHPYLNGLSTLPPPRHNLHLLPAPPLPPRPARMGPLASGFSVLSREGVCES